MSVPNFFIVGPPKAGTTSLYFYLDQHPQIYMSPIKEPCYFADEFRFQHFDEETQSRARVEEKVVAEYLAGPMTEKRTTGFVTQWDDYLKLFRNVDGEKAIGEASVCYLWSRTAPRNIASKLPEAKIVMMLRDPAERAFSAYQHTVTDQMTGLSFREFIECALRSNGRIGQFYPLLEFGMYAGQVKRYLDTFPREQLGIFFYQDYRRDPPATLRDVFRFLGVDDRFVPDMTRNYVQPRVPRFRRASRFLKQSGVWRGTRAILPAGMRMHLSTAVFQPAQAMTAEDRTFLIGHYRSDIEKLSTLLNRDLRAWLDESALQRVAQAEVADQP